MDREVLRILDANFNRAREALRVMEDYARFVLNDEHLTAGVKGCRHHLADALKLFPADGLLDSRDIREDVGTRITTPSETVRATPAEVAIAAGKRLSEALRSLEEYGKIAGPGCGRALEALRYRGYELERQILLRGDLHRRLEQTQLYVLVTERLCKRPVMETVQRILDAGVDAIQLREKELADAVLLDRACEIGGLCREAGVLFFLNDRTDIAELANADGVHLGQDDIAVIQARRILGGKRVVGISTHQMVEAEKALAQDPDYLAVGSIFGSPTKPQVDVAGLELIRQVRQIWSRPLLAIGGITPENAMSVLEAGATGVAVCQSVIAAERPEEVVRTFRESIASKAGQT